MKTTILIIAVALALAVGPAQAADFAEPDRIQYLAHDLEEAARHVHESAEAYAHHGGRRERRALGTLHRLDRQARHFHRQVERYRRSPRHTEKDYRRLVRAYYEAQQAMRGLHTFEHVYRDFHRVEALIDELAYYYEGRGHYRGHDGGHGYDGRSNDRPRYRGRFRLSLRVYR
jgi:hypothetical protein